MTIAVSSTSNSASEVKPSLAQPDAYLAALLSQRQVLDSQAFGAAWLQQLRDRAAEQVRQSVIPTTRHEEWRFTDLLPLQQVTFQAPAQVNISQSNITDFALPEAAHSRLVFVNGVYAPYLCSLTSLPAGVFGGNLAQLPAAYQAQIQDHLAQQHNSGEVFTALNTAGFSDVAVVWVAKNQVIEQPIHLLFISTVGESSVITQPRCLVVAETSSALTLVEEYTTMGSDAPPNPYWTNAVTEIWLKDNAQVNHSRIQREHPQAFHIGKTAIAQARNSRYTCNAISLGAKLSRHNLEVLSTGEQTETTLNGLTLIADTQLADTHSAIAFTRPYGKSNQLHKCIVNDRAHAVFNGKVFVPQAAQLTDAAQLNRNLLLSAKARMDTKPQLEIVADNVKCTHGATVGQLDSEEVFYLQSRGLDSTRAANLLIRAFAAEVIERIPVSSLRQTLTQSVMVEV